MPNQYTTPDARFWSRVAVGDICWRWTGNTTKSGYGCLPDADGRVRRAHKYAWWLATGEWPKTGQIVCHTCDDLYPAGDMSYRSCIRNDTVGTYEVDGVLYERRGHLWLGTHAANMRDMVLKGRVASGDRSPSRLYPDSRPRGDDHAARRYPGLHQGIKNGRATLTAELVLEIRTYYDAGGNVSEFARTHNLKRSAVQRAAMRRTWKHV